MASTFPGTRDSFTDPGPNDLLGSSTVPHASQHDNINDAMSNVQLYCPVRLAQIVADGTTTQFDFNPVNSGYESLEIIITGRSAAAAISDALVLRFNGDNGGNYYNETFGANNATLTGSSGTAQTSSGVGTLSGATALANAPGTLRIFIPGYARSVFHKTFISFDQLSWNTAAGNQALDMFAGRWASTAAVTRVTVLSSTASNIVSGSVATLYGWP